jgi:broad specificity phosphatase PhoE
MGAIYLVRHGQASYGTADYDRLSELGREQSRIVGETLRRRGVSPAVVVRGDMVRHAQTATEALRSYGDLPAAEKIVVDARWNEYDYSDVAAAHPAGPAGRDTRMTTMSSEKFQDTMDGALLAWLAAGDSGAAGVTWPTFSGRAADALADVAAGLASGQSAVVFTSGGPIAAICARMLGVPGPGFVDLNRVMVNGAITVLITGRRGLRLTAVNEHGHLERPEGGLRTYR